MDYLNNDDIALLEELVVIDAAMKKLTAERDSIRKKLLLKMMRAPGTTDPVGLGSGHEVKVTQHIGNLSLDKDKLQEALGDLTPYQKRGAPYVRWSIKKISD